MSQIHLCGILDAQELAAVKHQQECCLLHQWQHGGAHGPCGVAAHGLQRKVRQIFLRGTITGAH